MLYLYSIGNSGRLVWSHHGSSDFLNGVHHVTYFFNNHSFDCLKTVKTGRYFITLQVTLFYSSDKPPTLINSYVTLTRFRNNNVLVVAMKHHVIPSNSVKQPISVVISVPLYHGDCLCATTSHPELIYLSSVDSFFGLILLSVL